MSKHRARPNHKSAVKCIETGKIYSSIKEAAYDIGGNPTGISSMLSGHLKSYKGLHFEYVNIFRL